MTDDFVVSKMLHDIIEATNTAIINDDTERQFARMISDFFGIERVRINTLDRTGSMQNELYGYVSNTKKAYVDNQLSEYSSFPELIEYKNRGFRSCALLPIVVSGKVVSIVEMLSNAENKFSDDLISSASFGAYLTGLTILYKSESERSIKLAGYFDSAFNGPYPQFLIAHDGRIVRANAPARRDIFTAKNADAKADALIGLGFSQLVQLSKKKPITMQLSIDGDTRFYLLTASAISDRLVHLSMQDITELKRLGAILESMDADSYVSILYLDSQHVITDATESIIRAVGFERNLIIGKDIVELAIEKKRGEVKEMFEKFGKKERVHGTMDLATASGVPAHLRFVTTKWPNGYMIVMSNATSEGYSESIKSAFTDFINSTSDAVITMDALGYVKDCNMPAENVLGYSRSELIGKEMRTMYADQSVFERDITYVRNGSKVDNSYVTINGKNGRAIDATHSIRLFRSEENLDYIIVVKELETKRRLSDIEGQLDREKNRMSRLKATGDLKSQFIYNISHELKTPLTNIKGFSKLLYSGEFGDLNRDQLNYIGTIIEEADRLMLIIQQVLDAAKLESQKMKLELREVDLKELYRNPSIQAMEETATNRRLKFSWSVDWNVPKIMADPNRLIQAFVNLIGNSIKFTDKGSIDVKISLLGKTKVRCEVSDTGIGISEEDKRKLFRKFYEAPKKGLVKQEGAGTGLGLSITHEIVKLHGGRIGCQSEPGKGSTFAFTLRIKPKPPKKE
jgi:two-component system, NarL family, sensor histidine kinase BarA